MKFPLDTYGNYHASVSVFKNDGTVAISHGGVEMGQGINTKVIKAIVKTLQFIPYIYSQRSTIILKSSRTIIVGIPL